MEIGSGIPYVDCTHYGVKSFLLDKLEQKLFKYLKCVAVDSMPNKGQTKKRYMNKMATRQCNQ